MKCKFCGKHIDEVDCSCKMCTICGTSFDAKAYIPVDKAEERKS